ncbi:MAG: N-acetyltransferase [Crocinitomicaceae bacterium]|nr:N-acetyltransferase [Crocinitomicaceae bacterium]
MIEQAAITEARKEDLPGILEIWNHEILTGTAIFDETPKTIQEVEAWWKERKSGGFPVFVILEENQVMCYGTYAQFRPKTGYRISVEHSIYAHPESRGKGLGKLMMRKLIQTARDQKLENMIGVIDGSNYKSIRFHEKFGFIECGRMERIGIKFGRHLDIVIMQLQLRQNL